MTYRDVASIVRRDQNHETERWIFNILSLMAITMIVAMTSECRRLAQVATD